MSTDVKFVDRQIFRLQNCENFCRVLVCLRAFSLISAGVAVFWRWYRISWNWKWTWSVSFFIIWPGVICQTADDASVAGVNLTEEYQKDNSTLFMCCSGFCVDLLTKFSQDLSFDFQLVSRSDKNIFNAFYWILTWKFPDRSLYHISAVGFFFSAGSILYLDTISICFNVGSTRCRYVHIRNYASLHDAHKV